MLANVFLHDLLPLHEDLRRHAQLLEDAAHEVEAIIIADTVLGVLKLLDKGASKVPVFEIAGAPATQNQLVLG